MEKKDLVKLTKQELLEKLEEADWCDRELLKEYDERCHDGRIQFKVIDDLEEHFRKRREQKQKKAS